MTNTIYNPKGVDAATLPVIFGFNAGGGMGGVIGQLVSQDGYPLGSHASSSEPWLYYDLGIAEGYRPDRHDTFKKIYPDGYRMEFVPNDEIDGNEALQAAFQKNKELTEDDLKNLGERLNS